MIRRCIERDFERVYEVINDAAKAYKSVIPIGCWKEPYMSKEELRDGINRGVVFYGYEDEGELVGVMGLQHAVDVTLIRHAYVCTAKRNQGIGGALLRSLRKKTVNPMLVGTWRDAAWAICFYEKHGFRLVSPEEKDRLLRKYWSIQERQIKNSVVLADQRWLKQGKKFKIPRGIN